MGALVVLMMFGMFLVLLPLIALKVLFHLVFGVALLPFRLAFGALGVAGKIVALMVRLLVGVMGLLLAGAALIFGLVLLPLAPFILLFGLVWLFASAMRPRAVVVRP